MLIAETGDTASDAKSAAETAAAVLVREKLKLMTVFS
jgi:hypothetical protein